MAYNSIITNLGKKQFLYRMYTANASLSATQYLVSTQFKIGINNGTPSVTDTNIDYAVPISDGTVCDGGDNQLTGSGGGTNTSDNTTYYKEGAGVVDGKGQNLLANGTSTSNIWTLTPLTASVTNAKPFALWLYIGDAADLAKLVAAGTAFSIKFRKAGDAANLYYIYERTLAQLAVGWNWISSNTANISTLTTGAGGAPSTPTAMTEIIIEVTTALAANTFIADELVYDLLRQWEASDLVQDFVAAYPSIDYTNLEVTTRCYLNSTQANGFNINSLGIFNKDTSILLLGEDTMKDDSKSATDEFAFVVVDRVI
jgi:hypothetical protein